MRFWLFFLFLPIILRSQGYSESNFGIHAGLVLDLGSHENEVGLEINSFCGIQKVQLNAGTRFSFLFNSLGKRRKAYEQRINFGFLFLGGKREATPEAYFSGLIHNSSYNNAIECCGETFEEIKLYPEAEKFYVYRSISLACMKQPRDAIDALDSAIVINPDYADAYYQYGLNLMDLNRYDEAIPKFENAIRLDPENLEIYRHKIHALEELKRYEEAEQLKIDLQFLQNYPLDRDASNSPYYESSDYSSNQDSDSSDSSYQPSILGKDSTEYE